MAKTCKPLKVYAPTGDESQLYKDILKKTKDPSQALELWTATRTPEFMHVFGDWKSEDFEGRLDEFGEPLLEDIMDEEFIKDAEVLDAAKAETVSFHQSAEKMTAYKDKMRDILTRKIKELERSSSDTQGVKNLKSKLEKLRKNLRVLDWREAAQKFAANSKTDVAYATKRLRQELRKKEPNIGLITKYRNYLSAFDILNNMAAEIGSNAIMSESMQEELKMLQEVIADKEIAKNLHRNFMENHVAEKLSKISNKHDAKAIKEFLSRAPFDIKARERWLRFAGDSRDSVIALTAKLINEQQQKTRKKSIEFTRNLADIVERVEKERASYAGNPEQLYEPLLEKDSDGNLTGYFIDPKKSPNQYKKFEKEFAGTALFEFYEFYSNEYARLNDALPPTYRMGNKLPTILKKGLERVLSSENKLGQIKAHAKNKFEKTNTDTSTGELTDDAGHVVHQIPIHFTQAFDSAVYNAKYKELIKEGAGDSAAVKEATAYAMSQLPKSLSYDMAAGLQAFQYMAENYSDMSEIVDTVEGAKNLLKDRKLARTDSKGQAILDRAKGMQNNPIEFDGSESNAYKMIEALIETQVYGITEKDLGDFSIGSMQFDKRKLAKQLASYNSALMLGVNVMAGTANIMMGETMQWADAFGGEYYKRKDYIWAIGEYSKQLGNGSLLSDVGSRTPNSKIGLINEAYDVLGDYHPDGVGASDSSAVRRSVKSGSLFFINSMGEHMMQSKAMMATMHNTKTYNSEGKATGNLYDAHEVKNKRLSVKPDTYIKVNGELVKFGEKQKRALSRQTQALLRRMHGNYNRQTAAEWQRNAYFGLIGQFRKWINDGFARRWDKASYNEFADQELEGTYRSFSKFTVGLINQLNAFNFEIGRDWNDMTAHQKANVKKVGFEIGMFAVMSLSLSLLAKLAGELDEEKDKGKLQALRHSMYIANRLNMELSAYINPLEAWQLLKSPAASMSVVQQTATTLKYALPWNWEEKYESGYKKGDSKLFENFKRSVPLWKQVERMSPEGIKGQLQFHNIG